jgi:hypothetical protein
MVDQKTSTPPPYTPDTRAKGWRLELDHERIRQSDTWALATPELRPWLLMVWMVAWEQAPCASLPADDRLIAARIGMSLEDFQSAKDVLLRGWWLADDGRLYHRTLTELVLDMLARKNRERLRKANWRAANCENVTRDNTGTDAGLQQDRHVRPTGETTPEPEPEPVIIPTTSGASSPPANDESDPIFGHCLYFLTAKGCAAKGARSFLGLIRKNYGDTAVVQAVERAERDDISEPIPWIRKYLEARPKESAGAKTEPAWMEGLL